MRIILVGDEALPSKSLHKYLDEGLLQAEIVFCPSGPRAAEEAATDKNIIVMAHMNLPGKDHGLEVLKQVKEANSNAYTMLLLRTALFGELEERAREVADEVISIPIRAGYFRNLLRKVFRAMEDREDLARRRDVFRQINSFFIKTGNRPWPGSK